MVNRGESLATASVIESAIVEVKNPKYKHGNWREISPIKHICSTGEELHIKRAARIIKDAVYNEVITNTTLCSAFVEWALTRPSKPRSMNMGRFLRTDEGKLFQNWNRLSNNDKLQSRVEEFASSQNCTVKYWELLS